MPTRNPAAVREESHLEDMRSAIRGDFARLAERRGDQELMRVDADPGGVEDVMTPAPVEPEATAEEPRQRSWLARFVSP